ncbi:MAG: phosphoglycerate kinase, partial [Solirubrobacterales bacterium]
MTAAAGLKLGKRTVRDVDVRGKRVLVRADLNVPLRETGGAIVVADDARIEASVPTIELLRDAGAKVIICSHLGRPNGARVPELSLAPVAKRLGELLSTDLTLAPGLVGPEVEALVGSLGDGDVLMLENSRFEPGETKNDPQLAKRLARLADVFVDDAFGACHRAHVTTEGVAHHVDVAVAGLLLEREVVTLRGIVENPDRPLVVVIGGAKVSDKIAVIDSFLQVADTILIGGAMCFCFFKAQGRSTGDSLLEREGVELARTALDKAERTGCAIGLPTDLKLGREFSADTETRDLDGVDVPDGWMGLDIGNASAEAYAAEVARAGTIFWNGPMGAFELEPFSHGTRRVAEAVAGAAGVSVVGG